MIDFSQENLMIIVSYFLPGFLINMIVSSKLSLSKSNTTLELYKFLVFSFVNIFLYTLIDRMYLWFTSSYIFSHEITIIFLRNFFIPILIGVAISTSLEKEHDKNEKQSYITKLTSNLIQTLGLDRSSLTQSTWDYIFYALSRKGGSFVIVTLKNGTQIFGLFGPNSFASSHNSGNNNLFLEEIFTDFERLESVNSGIYIQEKDIFAISIPIQNYEDNETIDMYEKGEDND